jgi:hypothetical protein
VTELRELLERLSDEDAPGDADAIFDAAHTRVIVLRRRRRFWGASIAAALVVAGLSSIVVVVRARSATEATSTPSISIPPAPPGPTAAQLAGGAWSLIPSAPIPARASASVVWTGRELLVWGGQSRKQGDELRADGAAYDPSTRTWRMLPPSPLTARTGQVGVWTGRDLIVWGGYDNVRTGQLHVTADGAAYDPSANTWRMLPAAPLSARSGAIGVWTGSRVVLLGGAPAIVTDSVSSYTDAATYDPTHERWQHIELPTPPNGDPIAWRLAVPIGGQRVLAWSVWAKTRQLDRNTSTGSGGADIFLFDETNHQWASLANARGAIADPEEVLWTGEYALVRGIADNCGTCSRPFTPEVTSRYDPGSNEWTATTADPLPLAHLSSVWTGETLFSFNGGSSGSGPLGSYEPGDASVYDAVTNTWTRLKRAPFGCATDRAPIWTGEQVLVYCPDSYRRSAAKASGVAYIPA